MARAEREAMGGVRGTGLAVRPRQPERGAPATALDGEDRLRRGALLLLSAALFTLVAQAFVPTAEFVHRSDDAFYYFQVAANHPEIGFWSFDGVNPTNGVQPLWAVLLTGVAYALHLVGATDPGLVARVFVALAALAHFASGVVLFHLLARRVSLGVAVAAAGGWLFPLGLVWAHVGGLENSLYALALLGTVAYFHLRFLERPNPRRAVVLGVLLGLVALSRLNGVGLAAFLLGALVLACRNGGDRLRLAVVAGAVAAALVLPYVAWNQLSTGHPLPVSGVVKTLGTEHFLAAHGIERRLSPEFAARVLDVGQRPLRNFVKSRAADGLWVVGGRLVFQGAPPMRSLAAVLALLLVVPAVVAGPRAWLVRLRATGARLAPFWYVAAFAAADALLALFLFPGQVVYALVRWWLVPAELVGVMLVAALAAASVAAVGTRLVPPRLQVGVAAVALLGLVALHAGQTAGFYWDGDIDRRDWNPSWNDESYLAAHWLDRHVPADARVGSWNAGVLGYYTQRRVTNLDGLINSAELVPYLRDGRIGDYIQREGISYLSDLEPIFEAMADQLTGLRLTEVYRHHSAFARTDYVIYQVK